MLMVPNLGIRVNDMPSDCRSIYAKPFLVWLVIIQYSKVAG